MGVVCLAKALARVLEWDDNPAAYSRNRSSGSEVSSRLSTTAEAVQTVQHHVWNSNQAITRFMFKG